MKKKSLFIIIVLIAVILSFTPRVTNVILGTEEERFVTIILHAGENSYFDTPGVTEKESVQFKGEAFEDRTVPTNENPDMVFLGWALTQDATEADVIVGQTSASGIGTDLYAVWSDKCTVIYNVNDGYVDIEGGQYSRIISTNDYGANFKNIIPVHFGGNLYLFNGWYKNLGSDKETLYNEESIINEPFTEVHAKWKFNSEAIDDMTLDEVYHLEVEGSGKFFKFTPEETTVYEVFIENSVPEEYASGCIIITDENCKKVKISDGYDDYGNTNVLLTLKEGVTYYIQLREMGGMQKTFDAGIRKGEYKTVRFHIGREEQNDAWFGEDESCKVIELPFVEGDEIHGYKDLSYTLRDPKHLELTGWSTEPNKMGIPEENIFVEDDMDVYAIYRNTDSLILDANGGYFPLNGNTPEFEYRYVVGTTFSPQYEPHTDNNRLKIAGWSRNPNATIPDEDILERVTISDDLPKRLYAVYTDKVLETFDANGGYFFNNESIDTYESTKGIGHVFYGLSLFHKNSRMVPFGWVDHKGEIIPYTPDTYPYYHVTEDTKYTAVWGYGVILDANGGYFQEVGSSAVKVTLEYEGLFSLANVGAYIGEAITYDSSKYFAGWATTQDATEPNVFDGVTPVKGLDHVYAVWKDASYYYEKGEEATWKKGSEEGLKFVIKRNVDDEETIHAFTGVNIDGEMVTSDFFDTEEGSLILTLKPEYLEKLEVGKHEISVHFGTIDAKTSFTITQKEETNNEEVNNEEKENPKTGDAMALYISIFAISTLGIVYSKKKNFNN